MNSLRSMTALAAAAVLALVPASAFAQRQAPTPEQRLDRLERQISQLQRQVFPKGHPADTAGFSDEPAATQSSVTTLDQRLDALEKQMADMLRQSEENGHHLQMLDSDMGKLRSDEDQKIQALEQRVTEAATPTATTPSAGTPGATEAAVQPKAGQGREFAGKPVATASAASKGQLPETSEMPSATPATDPGEDAYSQGFHLWEAGNYDQAIASLEAFTKAYPRHRRVSYARNLIGRSQLSEGQPRMAAQTFLANYRGNPSGERAPDSLFYLGQALMQLGQPGQACKAYAEFDAIYGAKARPDLKKQETDAKAQAQCS